MKRVVFGLSLLLSVPVYANVPCWQVMTASPQESGLLTYQALTNKFGESTVRKKFLLPVKSEDLNTAMDLIVKLLNAFDRNYCVTHPTDTLDDAINALAAQMKP